MGQDSSPIRTCHIKTFQEIICLARGFGCLRLEDNKNIKGEGRIFSIIFKIFLALIRLYFSHFKGKILEHLAHKNPGQIFLRAQ